MGTLIVDSKSLLEEGFTQGYISPKVYEIISKCDYKVIDAALAADQDILDAKHFDILVILVDDSSSITTILDDDGNVIGPNAICEGQNLIINSFLGSKKNQREGFVVLTWLFNSKSPVQPLTTLDDPNIAMLKNGSNYRANGGTAMYDKAVIGLATALAFKVLAKKVAGADSKISVIMVSDGCDEHSKLFNQLSVQELLNGLNDGVDGKNSGFVFMGIESKAVPINFREIAAGMGVDDKKVFVTTQSPSDIRHTFYLATQTAMGLND